MPASGWRSDKEFQCCIMPSGHFMHAAVFFSNALTSKFSCWYAIFRIGKLAEPARSIGLRLAVYFYSFADCKESFHLLAVRTVFQAKMRANRAVFHGMMTAIKVKRVNQIAPGIRLKNALPLLYWMAIGAVFFCAIAAVRTPYTPVDHGTTPAPMATPTQVAPAATGAPTQQVVSAATAALPEKSYTGMVVSADSKEHLLTVKSTLFSKKEFNLGDNCVYSFLYSMLINNDGAANNLRPGEKVTVSYRNAHGVLIADHIEQQPMRFVGVIKRIDPDKHTLILQRCIVFMQLDIATDCVTLLSNEKAGSLADIHPGDHVIIMYETPDCRPTAWEITKTSAASPAR